MSEPIVGQSRYDYSATLARLTAAIANAGLTLFATIDQRAAAVTVGLTLRPTTLLVFGSPKAGTPLMDAYPLVALDLPLKAVIWDESGTVSVAYVPMSIIAERYGVSANENLVAAFDRTLQALIATVC